MVFQVKIGITFQVKIGSPRLEVDNPTFLSNLEKDPITGGAKVQTQFPKSEYGTSKTVKAEHDTCRKVKAGANMVHMRQSRPDSGLGFR